MSNLVIVAIPDENDRVWKVSSDKIPHLTLLYLGDADKVQNLESIMGFVQHAATTSLNRFYFNVDRRGELGADSADVLFFKTRGYDCKAVNAFRSNLLKDNNIKTAYDSATQFDGPWNPHLTLGYPAAPAKEDGDEYPFYNVEFNKIAVWADDYDGPEFLLTDKWDDYEVGYDDSPGLAMHDAVTAGAEFLEHHGVKGQKWGVRKVRNAARTAQDVGFEAVPILAQNNIRNVLARKATQRLKKEDLPVINAKSEYAAAGLDKRIKRLKNRNDPLTKQYRQEVAVALTKRLHEVASETKNASGTREYVINDRGGKAEYFWTVTAKDVAHAEDTFTLKPIFDEDGFIIDVEFVVDELKQALAAGEEFLEHFGVKGMRWGQHRTPPEAVAPTATSRVPSGARRQTQVQVSGGENHHAHNDAIKVAEARAKLSKSGTAALSNNELREVAQRLQLEQQVKQLTTSGGQKFVTNLLKGQGQQSINRTITKKAVGAGF